MKTKLSRAEQAADLDDDNLQLAARQLTVFIDRFSGEGQLSPDVVKSMIDMPVLFVIEELP